MNWVTLMISILLWMLWGMITAANGISITKTPGAFFSLWFLTLVMAIFYSMKHTFEEKPKAKK